ncbi:MAG: PH domain-containing protein [Spirochaetia bacterium]|jgi:hypothetical protein|nr:PH domain-containing protein [Spirochaetia bacterium]
MGLLNSILGNASSVSVDEVKKEWGKILAQDEEITVAYKVVRDYIILTPKRIIFIDVKGLSGKKICINSVPYRKISSFSVQTAGMMDLNAELVICIPGMPLPLTYTFDKNINIYEVQAVLADAIAAAEK